MDGFPIKQCTGRVRARGTLAQYQLQQTMWCSGGVEEEEEDILEDQCGVKYAEVHIYSKSLLLLECFGGEREPAMRVSPSRNLLERERYAQLNATLSVGSDSFLCVCGENAVLSSLIFMPRAAGDHSQSISALDPSRFIHSASATQCTSLGVGEGGRDIGEICRVSLREEGGRPALFGLIWRSGISRGQRECPTPPHPTPRTQEPFQGCAFPGGKKKDGSHP